MDVMAGYKQTEVGVIPEDWEVRPFSSVATITKGQVNPLVNPFRSMILVAPNHIESGTGRLLERATAAEQGAISGKYVFEKGNIIYSKIRPYLRKAVLAEFTGLCSADMYPLIPASDVSSRFLLASILDKRFSVFAEEVSMRTGIPKINREDLTQFKFVLPPFAEQEAIAEVLSDADALIDSLEQLIAKKRHLKQGAMQELLTGKTRLPGFQTKPGTKQTEVGVIPEEWNVKLLPEVCQFRSGKAHEQYISEFGQYVCVNSKFISTDGSVRKYCTANFCSARKDDVLMVMSDLPNGKALAKAYLVEKSNLYAVNQRVCALTAYKDVSKYLFYFLNRNKYFLKFDDGVNQTHLLNNVFAKCPVALPPTKAEQEAIATILSDMDAEITALEAKLAKARQIKQGMMHNLLTGKIRLL